MEVLVAMALLSMLMLTLGSALRTAAQVEARIDERIAENEMLLSTAGFLRQILEHISARRFPSLVAGQVDRVHFLGGNKYLEWIGIMPARHGAGGRYGFSLRLDEKENELVLGYSKISEENQRPETENGESRILVRNVTSFAIEYLDAESNSLNWSGEWSKTDKVPSALQIRVTTTSINWPLLVVRIRPLVPTDRSRSIFTTGGD